MGVKYVFKENGCQKYTRPHVIAFRTKLVSKCSKQVPGMSYIGLLRGFRGYRSPNVKSQFLRYSVYTKILPNTLLINLGAFDDSEPTGRENIFHQNHTLRKKIHAHGIR